MGILFVFNSAALGVGLAMDAFSVSIANGLADPGMSRKRMTIIAGCYGFFQIAMPLTGWFCVHSIAEAFSAFQPYIPWIALILLLYIGGKMLLEGVRDFRAELAAARQNAAACPEPQEMTPDGASGIFAVADDMAPRAVSGVRLTFTELLVQGIATSIDALSVGFTIAEYNAVTALTSSLIIGGVTFCICMSGLIFGKKFGERFQSKATIFGGLILIFIGLEIFFGG